MLTKILVHDIKKLDSNKLYFSEYLFLLTILIKPQSGFKIAFAMLDQDGNQNIDKTEFKVFFEKNRMS